MKGTVVVETVHLTLFAQNVLTEDMASMSRPWSGLGIIR